MKIIEEYDYVKEQYLPNVTQIEQLLISLLKNNSINFHSVNGRLKEKMSLEEKIIRKEHKYQKLSDITDIIGIRIITYTENVVDEIEKIIDREFIIDRVNSVDKRKKKPNEFGYLSLHLIVQLREQRAELCEYQQLKNVKFEIQIRSILQHAWAEIEHDIGYKNHEGIPEHLQRDFFRIASLLELADKEFISLLQKTNVYSKSVKERTSSNKLNDLKVDSISLMQYLNSALINELDKKIVEQLGSQYEDTDYTNIELALSKINYFNIDTLNELEEKMKSNKELIIYIAQKFGENNKFKNVLVRKGISLFYFTYALMKNYNSDEIKKFLAVFDILDEDNKFVNELMAIFKGFSKKNKDL